MCEIGSQLLIKKQEGRLSWLNVSEFFIQQT